MPPVLILLILLLPLRAGAEEILGGHEVKPHSRPYMAFIKSEESDGNVIYCGGFLIRDKFVLTAAHCNGSSMTVTLGAHNIKAKEETQQIIPVAKAIPHPDYNKTVLSSDIMLLKLKSKAKRTRAVKPLNLPRRNVIVKPGDVCSTAGWGWRVPNGTLSNILQEVELIVQKDWMCAAYFLSFYNANEICVGDPKLNRATLKGDSGGPLVCKKVAAGIITYGLVQFPSPEIVTRVSSFLPWIKKTVKHS